MAYGMNTLGFTAGAMQNNLYETEEERRRRLEQEAAAERAKSISAEPTPVKQTITTDPVTGEQKMTITGSVADLSPANKMTPTVSMPNMPAVPVAPEDIERDRREQFLQQNQTPTAPTSLTPVAPAPVTAAPAAQPVVAQQPSYQMSPDLQQTLASARQTASLQPGEMAGMPTTAQGTIDWDNILSGGQINEKIRIKMISDPTTPVDVRRAAIAQEDQNLRQQKGLADAQKTIQQAVATGDQRTIAQAMKGGDGSFLKAAFLSALGAKDLARTELEKLGFISGKWQEMTDQSGNRARIQVGSDGSLIRGFDQNGRELSTEQMIGFSPTSKRGQLQKGEFLVDENKMPFREVFDPNSPNNVRLVPIGHTAQPKGTLVRSTQSAGLAADVAGGRDIGQTTAAQTGRLPGALPGQGAPAAAPTPAPVAPAAPAQGTAPAAAPVSAPVAPVSPAAAATAAPTAEPVAGGIKVVSREPTTTVLPSGQYKTQQAIKEKAAGAAIETAETAPRENIKSTIAASDEYRKQTANASDNIATLDRIITKTDQFPQFFNILGSDSYRMFVAAQTDDAKKAALAEMARVGRIDPKDRPKFEELMNDIQRLELAGITGSGLSATQLNTERESQRAVSAFAVSVANTPQAARVQAEIAKAKVEYQKARSKYFARATDAERRRGPGYVQDQFDEKVGDKIYSDLRTRLETLSKPAAGAPGGGMRVLERKKVQ